MSVRDGGPAFPRTDWTEDNVGEDGDGHRHDGVPGMSLRDYFAGQALAGFLADPGCYEPYRGTDTKAGDFATKVATSCYMLADAMLAARTQGDAS